MMKTFLLFFVLINFQLSAKHFSALPKHFFCIFLLFHEKRSEKR